MMLQHPFEPTPGKPAICLRCPFPQGHPRHDTSAKDPEAQPAMVTADDHWLAAVFGDGTVIRARIVLRTKP